MRKRGRRGGHEEGHGAGERWLITYSDLITLLLAFFIIMYAMSKVDTSKYDAMARALNSEFMKSESILPHGSGISGTNMPTGTDGTKPKKNASAEEAEKKEQQLKDMLKAIQAYIVENNLEAKVSAADTPRGIAITLNDLFLFDLGKAELKPAAYPVLEKLASLVPTISNKVSIEGHTDNLPMSAGSFYKDNWGLSTARSLSVLRYFTNTAKLGDSNLMATAYADTMPRLPNTSEENRAKNRRVEIVVLRELQTDPSTTPKTQQTEQTQPVQAAQ
ncbi:flagellar motor protein MotB [Paenibacillus lutrae]|uniref:OmpA family protein n=1 Tax=Paenibacillus lutrae TaxID=2078573 RepID=A0A7X3FKT3_9BACL|nr:flagellar motor protein MotB [Paenibacillus lutrae]MVP01576.1 OmpA family protein [Paenibacillus lutrae]